MGRAHSHDLRVRVVNGVLSGDSRREAAELFAVSASSAIRWVRLHENTGDCRAKPDKRPPRSPLAAHRQWLLDLHKSQPDATLDEIAALLADVCGRKTSASAVSRFFSREKISFKKNRARQRTRQA